VGIVGGANLGFVGAPEIRGLKPREGLFRASGTVRGGRGAVALRRGGGGDTGSPAGKCRGKGKKGGNRSPGAGGGEVL